jgi:hypothetical protein
MGVCKILSGGSTSHSVQYVEVPNPDPLKFIILTDMQIGKHCILKLQYEGCTNFEGSKICVFEDSVDRLRKLDSIDPHFYEESSLIARFKPTINGWNLATSLCTMLDEGV